MTPRQFYCWIRYRHAWTLRWLPGRLYQVCDDCGRERSGWKIDVDPRFAVVPKLQRQKGGK